MAEITAQAVNDLRKATGLGLMECKSLLKQADGDPKKAMTLAQDQKTWTGKIQQVFCFWLDDLNGWMRIQLSGGIGAVADKVAAHSAALLNAENQIKAGIPPSPIPPPTRIGTVPGRPPDFNLHLTGGGMSAMDPVPMKDLVKALGQAAARQAPSIQWQEKGTQLELTWDATAARYLSVTHQAGASRTALAMNLTGGRAVVDAAALARGGEYEFSLSDGLNAHLIVIAR